MPIVRPFATALFLGCVAALAEGQEPAALAPSSPSIQEEAPAKRDGAVDAPDRPVIRSDRTERRLDVAETPLEIARLAERVAAVVGEAKIDPRLSVAAAKRNKEAAGLAEAALFASEAEEAKGWTEAYQILRQDFHRPRLHLLALESASAMVAETGAADGYLLELAHQEAEYLRQTGADDEIASRCAVAAAKLPARPFVATEEFVDRSGETFGAGGAFYIEYDAPLAITLAKDAQEGLKRFRVPIRYVRSPRFSPRGCQLVMSVVDLGRSPEESQRTAICVSGYLPCAFLAGQLEGEYMTLDRIEVGPDTRLIVRVATASADERIAGVPLSNSVAIPIVLTDAAAEESEIPEDDPFRSPSPTTSDANQGDAVAPEVAAMPSSLAPIVAADNAAGAGPTGDKAGESDAPSEPDEATPTEATP